MRILGCDEKQRLYHLIGIQLTYTRTRPGSGRVVGVIRPHFNRGGQCPVSEGT